MATYQLKVTDEQGAGVPAKVYFLQSEAGAAIVDVNGNPTGFETDTAGNYTFSNGEPRIYVRVESTGYVSINTTLFPGTNAIQLNAVSGPTVTITAKASTFWQKNKTVLMLLALLALLYFMPHGK